MCRYNEYYQYSYSNPGFSAGTGHFTQVSGRGQEGLTAWSMTIDALDRLGWQSKHGASMGGRIGSQHRGMQVADSTICLSLCTA